MTPIECFYLDLDKPLLVYQRRGGLVVVPFTLTGARHVVCVRIDPLDDDETVTIIPAYPRAVSARHRRPLSGRAVERERPRGRGRDDTMARV